MAIPYQGKGRKRGGGKNVMNVPGKASPRTDAMAAGKSGEAKYRASHAEKGAAVAAGLGGLKNFAGVA
jgi:hypothetical protein